MKFLSKIKVNLFNIRESIKRFPLTSVISLILVIVLIYSNENRDKIDYNMMKNINRLSLTLGLGIFLFLCITLVVENYKKNKEAINVLSYIIGVTALIIFYYLILNDLKTVQISRYIGTLFFLILAFFYIPRLNKSKDFEKYTIEVISSILLTIIYSAVLYIGLAAILLTIDTLFDINIQWQYYYYIFLMVVFIFGINLFLSKIPKTDVDLSNKVYTKSLIILLVYIVIPLLVIYNLILYAYFLKILISWEWPKGLVSHLVIWSSALSIGILFVITPVLEESKIAKAFKVYFPKFAFPILLMMFISITQRTGQYGITENRYYIILFGIWITMIMAYFSFIKPLRNIFIPISLSMVIIIALYGPFSSFSTSIRSQNKRLNNILIKNGLLYEGKIISKADTPNEAKNEINNIIYYFNNTHKLNDINILPRDFKTEDMKNLFGFEYNPYNPYNGGFNYFYYNTNLNNKPLNISDFDYYANISSWNNTSLSIDNLDIRYSSNNILIIKRGDAILLEQDIMHFVADIHNKNKGMNSKAIDNIENMTYIIENENIRVKLIFINVNGKYDIEDNITNEGMEFVLLIDLK